MVAVVLGLEDPPAAVVDRSMIKVLRMQMVILFVQAHDTVKMLWLSTSAAKDGAA